MLRRKFNEKKGKTMWALVSVSKPGKVLERYGSKQPSKGRVAKSEARVQYYKHR